MTHLSPSRYGLPLPVLLDLPEPLRLKLWCDKPKLSRGVRRMIGGLQPRDIGGLLEAQTAFEFATQFTRDIPKDVFVALFHPCGTFTWRLRPEALAEHARAVADAFRAGAPDLGTAGDGAIALLARTALPGIISLDALDIIVAAAWRVAEAKIDAVRRSDRVPLLICYRHNRTRRLATFVYSSTSADEFTQLARNPPPCPPEGWWPSGLDGGDDAA
jgi:hypothetical protein